MLSSSFSGRYESSSHSPLPALRLQILRRGLPLHDEEALMDDDGRDAQYEAWADEIQQWRYQENVEALKRCLKAGADEKAIKTLARECGVDIKHLTLDADQRTARVG